MFWKIWNWLKDISGKQALLPILNMFWFLRPTNLVYESVNQSSSVFSLDLDIGDYNYIITTRMDRH